jgi:hypothetical protein
MRNIAIFGGGSVTMGLGLEIELRPKYNDDVWLKENGLILPLPREEEDKQYWKENRYSKIVSDYFNLIEYNIHDNYGIQMGGNAIDMLWFITRNNKKFEDILKNTKYIFLEIGFIRWWDPNLHGKDDRFPSTINEILEYIENPNNDYSITSNAIEWLSKLDINLFWEESFKKLNELKSINPEIKFIIIPWSVNDNDYKMTKLIDEQIKNEFLEIDGHSSIMNYLNENKLMVGDVAKAFNGTYKYNYKDLHPCVKGHKKIADMIINHINKNEKI